MHPLALLAGLSAGWQWCGLRTIVSATIDPSPSTIIMLATVTLLASAIGPWLPERAISIAIMLIERRRRRGADRSDADASLWILRRPARDQSLLWLSLALIASAAGALTLLTLVGSTLFSGVYATLVGAFFWTDLTLTGLEWVSAGLFVAPCWIATGLVVSTLSPVLSTGEARATSSGLTAGVLVSLGAALITGEYFARHALSGEQVLLISVLPMFLLACIAAWRAQGATAEDAAEIEQPPEVAPAAEGLIWLLLVVWGVANVLIHMGWSASGAAALGAALSAAGLQAILTAAGLLLAAGYAHTRAHTASGCGMAVWAWGAVSAGAVTVTAICPGEPLWSRISLAVTVLCAGASIYYAQRAWLTRTGSEALGFAQFASAVLSGLAIGLIVGSWWALPLLGPLGAMAAGSLLAMAFGGFVQIHERDQPVHVRHRRLAVVFASLAGAILLFPADVQRWTRWDRRNQGTHTLPALTDRDLGADRLLLNRSICIIDADLGPGVQLPPSTQVQVLRLAQPADASSGAPEALRFLRMRHPRFDLIYQKVSMHAPFVHLSLSLEWFRGAVASLRPGGEIAVDLPVTGLTPQALALISRTFAESFTGHSSWSLLDSDNESPHIRLHGRPSGPHVGGGDDEIPPGHPLSILSAADARTSVHSLRRNRLTPLLAQGSTSEQHVLEWLATLQTAPAR